MTPSRAFYRALGMHAALTSHPLATPREQRKIAEDLAAVIEAFASEPPVIADSTNTDSTEHELTS